MQGLEREMRLAQWLASTPGRVNPDEVHGYGEWTLPVRLLGPLR
jgi:hypothetical protein